MEAEALALDKEANTLTNHKKQGSFGGSAAAAAAMVVAGESLNSTKYSGSKV